MFCLVILWLTAGLPLSAWLIAEIPLGAQGVTKRYLAFIAIGIADFLTFRLTILNLANLATFLRQIAYTKFVTYKKIYEI
jgi:hypothetical protein